MVGLRELIRKDIIKKIILFLAATVLTVYAAYFVAEKFFFDKFFYYKSVKYGYWVPGKQLSLKAFGPRAADMASLLDNSIKVNSAGQSVIAVVGDSYVWGQGLRNEDRFPVLLEKELNRIYPTRVLSLGLSGDNLLDNLVKYDMIRKKIARIDFFVFGMVNNDLLLNPKKHYDTELSRQLKASCSDRPFVYAPGLHSGLAVLNEDKYYEALHHSYDESYANLCLLHKIAPLLPRENALYFYFSVKRTDGAKYIEVLKENGLTVTSPADYPDIFKKYSHFEKQDFLVSQRDSHPSALANRMFAEILFQEITSRESWKSRVSDRH